MQIDRYTHLHFPSNNTTIASDEALSDATSRAGLSKPPTQSPAPASQTVLVRAESVVLKVQFPGGGVSQATQPVAGTYTDGRKFVAGSDPQVDSESQAADHQRAVDRNAGVFTQITLNKDGVLVAKVSAPISNAIKRDAGVMSVSFLLWPGADRFRRDQ